MPDLSSLGVLMGNIFSFWGKSGDGSPEDWPIRGDDWRLTASQTDSD